jgi:hypothetical protein
VELVIKILVFFHFSHDLEASATTGVEGAVTDFILPIVGDVVRHNDHSGQDFVGVVTQRIYDYRISHGDDVDGEVRITLMLDKVPGQLVH